MLGVPVYPPNCVARMIYKRNCPWTMHAIVALSDVDAFDGIGSSVGVTRGRNNSDQSVPLHLLLLDQLYCFLLSVWRRVLLV